MNNGNIVACDSIGIVFGWGSLAAGSYLEIIGFINNGTVFSKIYNKEVTNLLGASANSSIYNEEYGDGSKYRAIKQEDGTWTYESIISSQS